MKTNIGSCDGGIRFILGCVLLFLGVKYQAWWGLLGMVPIATAAIGFCPMYWLLHVDTEAWEDRFEAKHPHPRHPKH
jgi:Protein of unknown function (DUF2892)